MLNIRLEYDLKKELALAESQALIHFRREVMKAYDELVAATPIDTGEAKASWEMRANLLRRQIELTSDSEYMKFLNAGTSKQAPSRFIEAVATRHGVPIGSVVQYT